MKKNQPDKKINGTSLAGLGFQMVAMIGIFVAIGYYLDKKFQPSKPWFLLSFSIVGVIVTMLYLIRTVTRKN